MRAGTILGMDLSLTRTGLALIGLDDSGQVWSETSTVQSSGTKTATLGMRAVRLDRIAGDVLELADDADVSLAVVEGPSMGSTSRHGHAWDRGGLWWAIVGGLWRAGVPVVQAAPATRAKYACGNGRGSKRDVLDGMRATWPGACLVYDDEADALALAAIGAHWRRWPIPETGPGRAAAAIDAVDWTDVDALEDV